MYEKKEKIFFLNVILFWSLRLNISNIFCINRKEIVRNCSSEISYFLFSEENVDESKPVMLWSVFFTQKDMSEVKAGSSVPDNVFLMNGPGIHIDIDRPVEEVQCKML